DLVDRYLEYFSSFPAPMLDIFRCLALIPRAAVAASLREHPRALRRVLEDLPFSWHLVPLRDWLLAFRDYLTGCLRGVDDPRTRQELHRIALNRGIERLREVAPAPEAILELVAPMLGGAAQAKRDGTTETIRQIRRREQEPREDDWFPQGDFRRVLQLLTKQF